MEDWSEMKLQNLKKLRVGDYIVASCSSSLTHGNIYKVTRVEPVGYSGGLPVQVQRIDSSDEVMNYWPHANEVSHRLPRVGERVKVIGGGYHSIKHGEIKAVVNIITSDTGTPLLQLPRHSDDDTINFQASWVERIKKVKAISKGDTVKVVANSQGNPHGLHHIPIGESRTVVLVGHGRLAGTLLLRRSNGHTQTVLVADVKKVKVKDGTK